MERDFLVQLDDARRAAGEAAGPVVRERSPDGAQCSIMYSRCSVEQRDAVIARELALARAGHYSLEWKVYGHDGPPNLKAHLATAGFEAGPMESVMVLPVSAETSRAFDSPGHDVRRLEDPERLSDVAEISRNIGRKNVDEERRRLALTMKESPQSMSIWVAYVEGEPAACGRIYFPEDSELAELAGGRTKTAHRHRGLYTALVAARLREALARGRKHLFVDALPTSEPILKQRGFRAITTTQPFVYQPE